MKVKVKDNEAVKFKPITIELTIESEEELCSLWHRLDASPGELNDKINDFLKHKVIRNDKLWQIINDLVEKRNLVK